MPGAIKYLAHVWLSSALRAISTLRPGGFGRVGRHKTGGGVSKLIIYGSIYQDSQYIVQESKNEKHSGQQHR